MCGIEKDQSKKRIFLDECDMFEYNCDNQKGEPQAKYVTIEYIAKD